MAKADNTVKANVTSEIKQVEKEKTYKYNHISDYRKHAKIPIMLPVPHGDSEDELYEFVSVNGTTTQIRCGERVDVNYLVFEALTNPVTGKYTTKQICV